MTEFGERYDRSPDVSSESGMEKLSPSGISAMRGEVGPAIQVDTSQVQVPETPSTPASATDSVDEAPIGGLEQPQPTVEASMETPSYVEMSDSPRSALRGDLPGRMNGEDSQMPSYGQVDQPIVSTDGPDRSRSALRGDLPGRMNGESTELLGSPESPAWGASPEVAVEPPPTAEMPDRRGSPLRDDLSVSTPETPRGLYSGQLEPVPADNMPPSLERPEITDSPERKAEIPIPYITSDVQDRPRVPATLPDGSPTNITGDLNGFKDLNHVQGEVDGFDGTCGICATQCVANEHGLPVTEADVLKQAVEHEPPLCNIENYDPAFRGGTTPEDRAQLLTEMDIPSHVELGKNFQDLSDYIDNGKSVILSTNAGFLWQDPNYVGADPTKPNHAVTLIDVAHDPQTDEIQGFFINDSGEPDKDVGSGKFVDMNTMRNAWLNTGGKVVVSDITHR